MFEGFDVFHKTKGRAREQHHFSLKIKGHNYKGMVHGDKIHWYHPHPQQRLNEEHLNDVESKVFEMMRNHLEK